MASDFWLIVGLGNPGKKYEGTRHNMGFMTADILAERWSVAFSDHKGLAMLGKGAMNLQGRNVKFFLAKPLTYMNDSGNAVASISAYYQIQPDHVVVIHDDMDLEFGRIKVKAGGSAGGPQRHQINRQSPEHPEVCARAHGRRPRSARSPRTRQHRQLGARRFRTRSAQAAAGIPRRRRRRGRNHHLRRTRRHPGEVQWPVRRRTRT